LRDDLNNLFNNLLQKFSMKSKLLHNIYAREIDKRHYLQIDRTAGLLELIEEDKEIFENLSIIEFEIESLASKICRISGIEREHFEAFFLKRDEKIFSKIRHQKEGIKEILHIIIEERDDLIGKMKNKLGEIKNDMDSFSAMVRVKKRDPGIL